jgi:hypothetical protein
MGSASAGYPFGIASHCHGKIGAFSHKVQLFGTNFPLHVEFPRTNLYPSSASTITSKVLAVNSMFLLFTVAVICRFAQKLRKRKKYGNLNLLVVFVVWLQNEQNL